MPMDFIAQPKQLFPYHFSNSNLHKTAFIHSTKQLISQYLSLLSTIKQQTKTHLHFSRLPC
jgi:hypothetical protein